MMHSGLQLAVLDMCPIGGRHRVTGTIPGLQHPGPGSFSAYNCCSMGFLSSAKRPLPYVLHIQFPQYWQREAPAALSCAVHLSQAQAHPHTGPQFLQRPCLLIRLGSVTWPLFILSQDFCVHVSSLFCPEEFPLLFPEGSTVFGSTGCPEMPCSELPFWPHRGHDEGRVSQSHSSDSILWSLFCVLNHFSKITGNDSIQKKN